MWDFLRILYYFCYAEIEEKPKVLDNHVTNEILFYLPQEIESDLSAIQIAEIGRNASIGVTYIDNALDEAVEDI